METFAGVIIALAVIAIAISLLFGITVFLHETFDDNDDDIFY
jgi:hypothetical protein